MEAGALAGTCAGVRQTQQDGFVTCQSLLLPDPPLKATGTTRNQNLHPIPCTLSHCPISQVITLRHASPLTLTLLARLHITSAVSLTL